MKCPAHHPLPRLAIGALALLAFTALGAGCETKTTSKGFSSGYNYHKPGRGDRIAKPVEPSDQESLARADTDTPRPSGPEVKVPEPIEALGKGLGDMFELITPPPQNASGKPAANSGAIPNNFTGTHEVKDKNGNTVLVHFDRGRIIKKEVIPEGSDKPISDAPKVFRSEQPRP